MKSQFIKLKTLDGIETIINMDHIVTIEEQVDFYKIDMLKSDSVYIRISESEYKVLKGYIFESKEW